MSAAEREAARLGRDRQDRIDAEARLATQAALLRDELSRLARDVAVGFAENESAEDAFTQLRAMSQAEHRKLADVAQQMVDEAVRRARARQT